MVAQRPSANLCCLHLWSTEQALYEKPKSLPLGSTATPAAQRTNGPNSGPQHQTRAIGAPSAERTGLSLPSPRTRPTWTTRHCLPLQTIRNFCTRLLLAPAYVRIGLQP
jgi:hypothetical protein